MYAHQKEPFLKITVPKNLAIFIGKHLRWSLFFNKVAGLKVCTFIKNRFQRRCFPMNIAKFLRAAFFIEHFWQLLLAHESIGNWCPSVPPVLSITLKPY